MGWDGDEMAEEGIIALYGIDTFLPFFSPTDKLDWSNPTVPHTQYPSSRILGSPALVTHPSQLECHVPLPDLVFHCRPLSSPSQILSTYNILTLSQL